MIPLLILGLLQQRPTATGYELLSYLRTHHLNYVIHVTKGSFYYNLQQLADKGWLAPVPSAEAKENRYRTTDSGTTRFRELMVTYGQVNDVTPTAFYLVLLFADQATDLMPTILDQQITTTKAKIQATDLALTTPEDLLPSYATILANTVAHHRANLAWFQRLHAQYPS